MTKDVERYLSYWKDLTKKVVDLIEITRPITTGAENKFGQWPMKGQYDHINSEVLEAYVEYVKSTSEADEIDEDMDILMTILTLLHKKSYSGNEIKFSMSRLLKKFEEKGFINFDKE